MLFSLKLIIILISPMGSSRKEEFLGVTKKGLWIRCVGNRESIRTSTVWNDLLKMWENKENGRKGIYEATVLTKALFSLWRNFVACYSPQDKNQRAESHLCERRSEIVFCIWKWIWIINEQSNNTDQYWTLKINCNLNSTAFFCWNYSAWADMKVTSEKFARSWNCSIFLNLSFCTVGIRWRDIMEAIMVLCRVEDLH